MAQTSRPESSRSSPNRHLQRSNVNLCVESVGDLVRRRCLKEQLNSFFQITTCLFNSISLAGDVQLRAESDETIILSPDSCGQRSCHFFKPPSLCSSRRTPDAEAFGCGRLRS